MRIFFLGTSAGTPTRERNVSGLAIRREGELLLFDVGEGTQRQLMKAGLGLKSDTKIFITHMHGDHLVGLLALLQSFTLTGKETPLEVFGPPRISEFVQRNLEIMRVRTSYPIEITVMSNGIVHESDGYTVRAQETSHSVETYALALQERQRPGRFDPKKARSLGVPRHLWSKLQSRKTVTVDGRKVDPSRVLSEPRRGRKIAFSSDTYPFDEMVDLAEESDVLIHEATYAEDHADKTKKHSHSSAKQAARIAKQARAELLVLTHFSTRYDDLSAHVEEARAIFPRVVAARDLMTIDVVYPESFAG